MRRFFVCMLTTAFSMLIGTTSATTAAIIPVGVQQNVSVNTVLNTWGWSIAYQGDYGASGISMATVFSGVSAGDYIMYAAKRKDSNEFALLAAGLETDVRTYTAKDQVHTANGVAWYYNGGSMGFAAAGQSIFQSSADVMDAAGWGYSDPNNPDGSTRLSWHTAGNYGNAPTQLNGGWRAGNDIWLNNSTDWERFVLVARVNNAIPEPGSFLVWGVLGLASAGLTNRRRKG